VATPIKSVYSFGQKRSRNVFSISFVKLLLSAGVAIVGLTLFKMNAAGKAYYTIYFNHFYFSKGFGAKSKLLINSKLSAANKLIPPSFIKRNPNQFSLFLLSLSICLPP